MENFGTVIFAALLVEAIINIVVNIKEGERSWKYWSALILGILVSVLVTYNWNIDLFAVAGMPAGKLSFVGPVLTGLILSRGSNVVSDLLGLINSWKGGE